MWQSKISTGTFNIYRTSVKNIVTFITEPQNKALIFEDHVSQNWEFVPLILLHYKKIKTSKILKLNFSYFESDQ